MSSRLREEGYPSARDGLSEQHHEILRVGWRILCEICVCSKLDAFNEECEWRAVEFVSRADGQPDLTDVLFRTKGDTVIPYKHFVWMRDEDQRHPLMHVQCGP